MSENKVTKKAKTTKKVVKKESVKEVVDSYTPNALIKFFSYSHLPKNLQPVSKSFHDLAVDMDKNLPNNAEKTTGLRKLLEAKDCFVRANIK